MAVVVVFSISPRKRIVMFFKLLMANVEYINW